MARVVFTANLERFVACPPTEVAGATVAAALDDVFETNPRLRSYLLDEHGRLRKHINVYLNDRVITDRVALSDAVCPGDEIFVFQALSGGK